MTSISENSSDDPPVTLVIEMWSNSPGTHIAATDCIHRQQVVPVAKLKPHHLLSSAKVTQLLLLRVAALLYQIFEQQCVFAHPLNGLQQVGRQIHLVSQLQLLILDKQMEEGSSNLFINRFLVMWPVAQLWGREECDQSSFKRTLKNSWPWLLSRASDCGLFLLYRAYIPNWSSCTQRESVTTTSTSQSMLSFQLTNTLKDQDLRPQSILGGTWIIEKLETISNYILKSGNALSRILKVEIKTKNL